MRITIPFLLLATHMGAGILLMALTVSPHVQKNFFRMTALLAAALLALTLPIRYQPLCFEPFVLAVSMAALAALAGFLWMLKTERTAPARRWLFLAALLAMVTTGLDMDMLRRLTGFPRPDGLVYAGFFLSSLLLGSTIVAMLIGHWYVMDTAMSIAHLKKLSTFYTLAVVLRLLVSAGAPAYYWAQGASGRPLVAALVDPMAQGLFFWLRVCIGLVGPLVLSFFVARTVNMRSTLSATGLLYVAVVLVIFGELLAKFLLTTAYIPV